MYFFYINRREQAPKDSNFYLPVLETGILPIKLDAYKNKEPMRASDPRKPFGFELNGGCET